MFLFYLRSSSFGSFTQVQHNNSPQPVFVDEGSASMPLFFILCFPSTSSSSSLHKRQLFTMSVGHCNVFERTTKLMILMLPLHPPPSHHYLQLSALTFLLENAGFILDATLSSQFINLDFYSWSWSTEHQPLAATTCFDQANNQVVNMHLPILILFNLNQKTSESWWLLFLTQFFVSRAFCDW